MLPDTTRRPLLYTYRRCPYAMRARMALLQAGIAFDAHEIVLRDKPADLLRLSPKGTVPVLVVPGGEVVDQSLDIMQWAFGARDTDGWWARAQSTPCRELVALNDGPFKQHLDGYKYPERDPSHPRPEFHRDAAVACLLGPLDRHHARHRFLGGETPCAADLAIFPFVRQFRAVDSDWFEGQDLHAVRRWLEGWLASDLFARCMAKLPTGATRPF